MEPDHHPPPASQISAAAPPEADAADVTEPSAAPTALENPPIPNPPTINPPKRQRRPSVRLGEIGGVQPHDTQQRRASRTWRFHKDPSLAAKSSRTRPLTNLINGGSDSNFNDSVEISDNYVDFGLRKPKIRKPARKTRTNWNRFDPSAAAVNNGGTVPVETPNFLQEEDCNNNLEFRELEAAENSESPMLKEHQSPINSEEHMGLQFWDQHRNGLHQNETNSVENHNGGSARVRDWLIGLGLGRYAPVFEIHEVDDEVLPMLTAEDLKDMGINAVGSRRKMYTAILKLRKGMSIQ